MTDPSAPPAPPRARGLRSVFLGVGAACLAVAVVVGLYGSLIATGPRCVGACGLRPVSIVLWVVTAVAAGLILWVLAALRAGAVRGLDVGCVSLALIAAVALGVGLPVTVQPVYRVAAITPQQPLVTAVFWLTLGGAVATAIGAAAVERRGRRPLVLGGVAVGLVVALAFSGTAWWTAVGAHGVEATAATGADIPRVPDTLGERAFRVQVGEVSYPDSSSALHLYAAGVGFVLWQEHRNDVTAYDASGVERWHYRRSGPSALQIAELHPYADGRVVVLALRARDATSEDYSALVGLDAITGRELWSASGPALSEAFYGDYGVQSPFLVARGNDVWTAFDPRTGEQTWQVPSPTPCGHVTVADTAATVVGIEHCPSGQNVTTVRAVGVDPATGATRFAEELIRRENVTPDGRSGPAGGTGSAVRVEWGSPDRSSGVYQSPAAQFLVDADGTITDFGLDRIEAAGWPVGGFVLRPFPGPLYLYGTDRLRRCRLPDDTALGSWRAGDAEAAWLGRQLVVRHGADDTLRAIDRSDCRIVATEPVGDDVMVGMVAAPGVLAVLVVDDRGGVFVQGYRP